jgi:GTP-binding protein
MFVDEIKIYTRAGHGGKGCIAFHREAYIAKGGPSGGNGGRGGSVILQADHDLNNLIAQYYQPRLIAEAGEPGFGKGMDGHAGKNLVVKVPCGTLVWRLPSAAKTEGSFEGEDENEDEKPTFKTSASKRPLIRSASGGQAQEIDLSREDVGGFSAGNLVKGELVADLTENGQQFVICKGGRGGLGNRNFATAARQTPRFAQPGEPGEEGAVSVHHAAPADWHRGICRLAPAHGLRRAGFD